MVFFNYATMQMAAKIVYYGPGLCGKTTNLHVIYGRTAPTARGEMVSLETETDRTLFFDLLPIDVGVIGGFKTRLQLYTVPGQVFYNTTRKLVLKGVDGIVFVADSQRPMLEPNRESFRNLRENLAEIGISVDDVPLVLQYNKRDLSNILSVAELDEALNPQARFESYEASAANGTGVFETLKGISKLTLRALRSRMTGEVRRPAVFAAPATPAPSVAVAPAPPAEPAPAPVPPAVPAPRPPSGAFPAAPAPSGARVAPPSSATLERLARFSEIARQGAAAAPDAPAEPAPARPIEEQAAEISFGESATPAPVAAEPAVKHVKVRSSVDILSELDKLRKLSTQKAPAGSAPRAEAGRSRGGGVSIDDLLASNLNHKKDVSRSFDLTVPRDVLGKSRQVTIELRFSDGAGSALLTDSSCSVDISSPAELQKLLLSLRFNVQAE